MLAENFLPSHFWHYKAKQLVSYTSHKSLCFFPHFLHLIYVCFINGTASIFSYLLGSNRESNSDQFTCTYFEGHWFRTLYQLSYGGCGGGGSISKLRVAYFDAPVKSHVPSTSHRTYPAEEERHYVWGVRTNYFERCSASSRLGSGPRSKSSWSSWTWPSRCPAWLSGNRAKYSICRSSVRWFFSLGSKAALHLSSTSSLSSLCSHTWI